MNETTDAVTIAAADVAESRAAVNAARASGNPTSLRGAYTALDAAEARLVSARNAALRNAPDAAERRAELARAIAEQESLCSKLHVEEQSSDSRSYYDAGRRYTMALHRLGDLQRQLAVYG